MEEKIRRSIVELSVRIARVFRGSTPEPAGFGVSESARVSCFDISMVGCRPGLGGENSEE